MSQRSRQPNGQRVTSADVAAAAGVSRATVSYVLNGVHDRISEQTRARVFDAAERLGYVPNAVASALRAGRTEIVLLALPSWPLGPAVAEWVSAGVAELERIGYTPLVHFRHGDDQHSFARACDRVRPVALVAPGEDLPPARVASLKENGTRALLAIAAQPLEHVATIVVDQSLVGRIAIEHLVERGHGKIVAVVPSEAEFAAIGAERLRGAESVPGASILPVHAACSATDIARALEPVLAERRTAIYAFNDEYALGAIEALDDAGLSVPGEVAVIGCDDSAAARRTHLTTIRLGDPSHWQYFVARLQAMVEGGDDRSPIVDPPKVVQGATT
jgi:DNA-binding LacI/PurR family transcriptional regulator